MSRYEEGASSAEIKKETQATLSGARKVDIQVALPNIKLGWKKKFRASLSLPVILVIVLFTLVGATKNANFLNGPTWLNILTTASFTSIVACFEGFVLISGGLDLSVGAVFLTGAMVSAELSIKGYPVPVAILGALLAGAVVGALNGGLANYVGISPIIATLGTLFCTTAVVTTLSKGLAIGPLSSSFSRLAGGTWGPIPTVIFYALGIALIAHIILRYSTFGMKIRAVGGNRSAVDALGLNAKRISMTVYIMTGVAAAFAGVLQCSYLGAGAPSYGSDLELQVIAAVVIGGVSVLGAVGEVSGMVIGCILLSLLSIGLLLLHFAGSMQDFVVGFVMVIAVSIDKIRRTFMFRVSRNDIKKAKNS